MNPCSSTCSSDLLEDLAGARHLEMVRCSRGPGVAAQARFGREPYGAADLRLALHLQPRVPVCWTVVCSEPGPDLCTFRPRRFLLQGILGPRACRHSQRAPLQRLSHLRRNFPPGSLRPLQPVRRASAYAECATGVAPRMRLLLEVLQPCSPYCPPPWSQQCLQVARKVCRVSCWFRNLCLHRSLHYCCYTAECSLCCCYCLILLAAWAVHNAGAQPYWTAPHCHRNR